jgi:hypothetical protein
MKHLTPKLSVQELKHRKYLSIYECWEMTGFDTEKTMEKTGEVRSTVMRAISYSLKFQQTDGWDDGVERYK